MNYKIFPTKTEWHKDERLNKLHCTFGAAIEHVSGDKEYYIEGKRQTYEEFLSHVKNNLSTLNKVKK